MNLPSLDYQDREVLIAAARVMLIRHHLRRMRITVVVLLLHC